MSNINIKSDMGGGNSLNIIRISSLIPLVDITTVSSLNGNISPRDTKCWNFTGYYAMLQDNTTNICYCKIDGDTGYNYFIPGNSKSDPTGYNGHPLYGRFIIEFKE